MTEWLVTGALTVSSERGRVCLPPLDLEVATPTTFVLGSNGAGKSILGRALTGLLPSFFNNLHVSGSVKIRGLELESLQPHDPRCFAYLPQASSLVFMGSHLSTDLEMLQRRLGMDRAVVETLLEESGLQAKQLLMRHPATLSRGERQRVALATMTALRPKAVYLDEPDAFLDEYGIVFLQKCLGMLEAEGAGILVATHHPERYSSRSRVGVVRLESSQPHFDASNIGRPNMRARRLHCSDGQVAHHVRLGGKRSLNYREGLLQPGVVSCVFGQNGAGKTSLLRHIARRLRGEGGFVLVTEEPDEQLIFRTVAEELKLVPASREVPQWLAPLVEQLLGGLDQPISHLSWGRRRLLTILLAVLQIPSVLLVDEPEAGLDGPTAHLVCSLLNWAAEAGTAVLMTANFRGVSWRVAKSKFQLQNGTIESLGREL